MKIGLFQDPRTPGIYYAVAEDGRKAGFNTHTGRCRLAEAFGYEGKRKLQDVIEWLAEKATVIIPQQAELECEDPGIFNNSAANR